MTFVETYLFIKSDKHGLRRQVRSEVRSEVISEVTMDLYK